MQLALLTHAKLLDLMPADKRSSELLAAVQTVATSLRSMDEIEGTLLDCMLPSTQQAVPAAIT